MVPQMRISKTSSEKKMREVDSFYDGKDSENVVLMLLLIVIQILVDQFVGNVNCYKRKEFLYRFLGNLCCSTKEGSAKISRYFMFLFVGGW